MGYGDYYWGLYRDLYRDPFPDFLTGPKPKEIQVETFRVDSF